ncbi:MAG TPA: hypothetical protein VF547_00605 [Allosphingosinicella sp.]|jgi:hypothetical protein
MPRREEDWPLDEAFERIEESILPSLSLTIDGMIEAATLARPGHDAELFAAELRTLGLQLEALTRQVEAVSRGGIEAAGYRAASAA